MTGTLLEIRWYTPRKSDIREHLAFLVKMRFVIPAGHRTLLSELFLNGAQPTGEGLYALILKTTYVITLGSLRQCGGNDAYVNRHPNPAYDSKRGIIHLCPNFITTLRVQKNIIPSVIGTLLHESWHSNEETTDIKAVHVMCPNMRGLLPDFVGLIACDDRVKSAFGLAILFQAAVNNYCVNCNEAMKFDAMLGAVGNVHAIVGSANRKMLIDEIFRMNDPLKTKPLILQKYGL